MMSGATSLLTHRDSVHGQVNSWLWSVLSLCRFLPRHSVRTPSAMPSLLLRVSQQAGEPASLQASELAFRLTPATQARYSQQAGKPDSRRARSQRAGMPPSPQAGKPTSRQAGIGSASRQARELTAVRNGKCFATTFYQLSWLSLSRKAPLLALLPALLLGAAPPAKTSGGGLRVLCGIL